MCRCVLPLAIGLLLGACKKPAPPPTPEEELAPPPKAAAPAPKAEALHRCAPLSSEPPFVLGPADTGRTPALKVIPAGSEPGQLDSLPFAAEVGEGVAWSDGFAVGAIHESEAAHSMSVVTLDRTGHGAKVMPLGTAHGDIEPPRVTARGATLLAGMLSPGINGRSLRLAKIELQRQAELTTHAARKDQIGHAIVEIDRRLAEMDKKGKK